MSGKESWEASSNQPPYEFDSDLTEVIDISDQGSSVGSQQDRSQDGIGGYVTELAGSRPTLGENDQLLTRRISKRSKRKEIKEE